MEEKFKFILENWQLILDNIELFSIVVCLSIIATYWLVRNQYQTKLDNLTSKIDSENSKHGIEVATSNQTITNLNEKIQILEERLIFKTELAESYKTKAEKFDMQIEDMVTSDDERLIQEALEMSNNIRSFSVKYKKIDDELLNNHMASNRNIKTKEEFQENWNRNMHEMSKVSSERKYEWERKFKVPASMLRDELLSRMEKEFQDNYQVQRYNHAYENPVNYFCYTDVADDLERLARLLSKQASRSPHKP